MLAFHSLSAYHPGQGGTATGFISLPEYSEPAKATEAIAAMQKKLNVSFFSLFQLDWVFTPLCFFLPTETSQHKQKLIPGLAEKHQTVNYAP